MNWLWIICFVQIISAAPEDSNLNFTDAYKQIMARSLRLENQHWSIADSAARRLAKQGLFLPSLTARAQRTDDQVSGGPKTATPVAALDLGLNVFHSRADEAALDGALADERKEKINYVNEQIGAEQDAVEALVLTIQRFKEADIVEKIMKLKEEAYAIATKRYQKGVLPILEVEKASIELDNSKARKNNVAAARSQAEAVLSSLLGHARLRADWPWKDRLTQQAQLDSLRFNIENRPDVQVAELQLRAEGERTSQAERQMLPSVDLSVTYGLPNLRRTDVHDWTTVVAISVPIFDRLQNYTAYRQQVATRGHAEVKLEALKRQAPAQIETLQHEFRIALDSAHARDRTLEVTRRMAEDGQQRFRIGRISVNELTFDQSRLLDTELLDVEGWATAHTAFARLCHALGESLSADGACGSLIH